MNLFMLTPVRQEIWRPAADVYRNNTGWMIKFDLAGVRLEDINVRLGRRSITVSGVRRGYMLEQGCSYYSMEITYNRFERTIEVPAEVGDSSVSLDYRDGILMVRIQERKESIE